LLQFVQDFDTRDRSFVALVYFHQQFRAHLCTPFLRVARQGGLELALRIRRTGYRLAAVIGSQLPAPGVPDLHHLILD